VSNTVAARNQWPGYPALPPGRLAFGPVIRCERRAANGRRTLAILTLLT